MLKYIAIILSVICMDIIAYAGLPVDFSVQSEYKKDTIDYSDITRYYYREKLSIMFSKESALNLSCIYLDREKDYKYTWNLFLNDISDNLSFIAGNYFTHFGSGLLIGKKRTFDPDIFSFRITENESAEHKPVFTPCNTGNPVFAFNGMGGTFSCKSQDIKLAINAFYSIKERFIDDESYDSNRIESTIDTLDAKTKHEYNHTEPVEIHTGGAMLSGLMFNCILFESYYLNADIRSRYKKDILWEHGDEANGSEGISELNGFGFLSEYRDAFFNVLIDGACTQKVSITDKHQRKKERDYAALYRLRFAPPFLKMTITGKEVGKSFYSPYGSSIGEDCPESAWFFDAEIKPYSNLKLAAKASSQKKTAPSSADEEPPLIKKEIISAEYSAGRLENIEIVFKRREKIDEEKEIKKQVNFSTNVAVTEFIKMHLSALYGWIKNGHQSTIYRGGIQLLPAKEVKLNLTYLSASISGNSSIYSIVTPLRDSSTPGFYFRENSSAFVIQSEIKITGIIISGRYFHQFNRNGTLHTRLEFYASGCF